MASSASATRLIRPRPPQRGTKTIASAAATASSPASDATYADVVTPKWLSPVSASPVTNAAWT